MQRSARLAARLQLLTYAWRFARGVGGRVVCLWPRLAGSAAIRDGDAYHPATIFDLTRFYAEGGADELVFLEGSAAGPAKARSLRDDVHEGERREGFQRERLRSADIFFERLPPTFRFADEPDDLERFRADLRTTWDRLPYQPAVDRTLEAATRRTGDDYVALHVRRGDVIDSLRRELPLIDGEGLGEERFVSLIRAYVTRVAPLASYEPAVRRALQSGQRIVFTSDSPETIDHFVSAFGRGAFIPTTLIAQNRPPIFKAFVDFNLIMRSREVISTDGIYASFAAMLGGGRLTDISGEASLELMERELLSSHLRDIPLSRTAGERIRGELARQYGRVEADRGGRDGRPPLPRK